MDHFQFRVDSHNGFDYYIDTRGYAFSKNQETGKETRLQFLNKTCLVKIGYRQKLLDAVIYFTTYGYVKKHKILHLDDNPQNCKVTNLVNLQKEQITKLNNTSKAIIVRNNNSGVCKVFTPNELKKHIPQTIYYRYGKAYYKHYSLFLMAYGILKKNNNRRNDSE